MGEGLLRMMRNAERKGTTEEERVKTETRTPIAKVIEIIGNSDQSFENAIERAVETASQSLRHITGCEVRKMSVVVKDGRVAEYRVDMKIAFGVEPGHLHGGESS